MFMSVLQFQDSTGEIMVARLPQEGTAEFITGSQLIVQDGQLAIFYRDGRPLDGFRPGRHTLTTQNLPLITRLINVPTFGAKSPFRAYIYFIQLKVFTNLGWGTPTPILFRDQELKAVSLRAHGTFSLKIQDPNAFLRTIIGSQGLETTFAIEEYVRRIIVSRFANFLPNVLTSVFDLAQRYRDIEVGLKQAVHDDLAQYGLETVDLLVEAITVPTEVQDMINRAAGTRALDTAELSRYEAVAVSDALRAAATQPGGGMADMMGIGAGMAVGQQIAGAMTGQSQSPAPPPLPPQGVQWYAGIGGQQVGPLDENALRVQIQSGQITAATLVWRQGLANWEAAGSVPELAPLFTAAEPPPLPQG